MAIDPIERLAQYRFGEKEALDRFAEVEQQPGWDVRCREASGIACGDYLMNANMILERIRDQIFQDAAVELTNIDRD